MEQKNKGTGKIILLIVGICVVLGVVGGFTQYTVKRIVDEGRKAAQTAESAKDPASNTKKGSSASKSKKNTTTEPEESFEAESGSDGYEEEAQELTEGDTALGDTTGIVSTTETAENDDMVVTDVTRVVEKVMPCVVSIFGEYMVEDYFWGMNYSYESEGSGSGFIVGQNEKELLIVTNNHVVEDSTEMTVQFIDESVAPAYVKGTDERMDLAVISVLLQDLDESTIASISVATLGDSDRLRVGEPAIAIGNALGYGQSVTAGVISALNRSSSFKMGPVNSSEKDEYALIQTDAAINPGNSGGALLNVRGEVVGINSSKLATTEVEGMGYAIPITTAKPVIEKLMNKKTMNYARSAGSDQPYMGVSVAALPEAMKERYGMEFGCYVTQVFKETGAEKAGLSKGDVLTAIDNEAISDPEDLNSVLSYYEVGDEVTVIYMKRENGEYVQASTRVLLGKKR